MKTLDEIAEERDKSLVAVGTVEVRGEKYPVFFRHGAPEYAQFEAPLGDKRAHGESPEKVRVELLRLTRRAKAKIHIPFVVLGPKGVSRGVITGIHVGTNNILVRWENGKTEQIVPHHTMGWLQGMTPAEERELAHLAQAAEDSARALRVMRDKFSFRAPVAIEEAYKAAEKVAAEKESA